MACNSSRDGPCCPLGSPPGGGADVHAVSVQETVDEVDHCLPFIFYLDTISEVHDFSLRLGMCFGLHVKSGKTASTVDSRGIALSLGLLQAAPSGQLKESHSCQLQYLESVRSH